MVVAVVVAAVVAAAVAVAVDVVVIAVYCRWQKQIKFVRLLKTRRQ